MKKNKAKATSPRPSPLSGEGAPNQPMVITPLPLAAIKPDPNQPRKVFDPEKLQELAHSIKAVGIQQPLVVQLRPPQFKIQEPDLIQNAYVLLRAEPDWSWKPCDECDQKNFKGLCETWAGNFGGAGTPADYEDRYQLIFGERRWRAAAMAGLDTLPCIVREVTEKDRFILQFIENNARENLSALEEAGAFENQLRVRKLSDESFNADKLAEELGIGRATVYGRLKLTRLHGPVRDALMAGKISTSVAGSVAIIPDPKQQEALLAVITNEEAWPYSARDVEELVEDEYVKQLDGAPFKSGRDEIEMFDANGRGLTTCRECPHRSGNMKEQFPELAKRPNVCTNPACFGEKVKAHWINAAADEQAAGKKVLTAKEFKAAKSTLVKASESCTGYYGNSWETELGKQAPEPVLVATAEGLVKYYPKDEAVAAAKEKGVKLPKENKPQTAEAKAKEEAKEKEASALRAARTQLIVSLAPRAAVGMNKLKEATLWRFLVKRLDKHPYLYSEFQKALFKNIKGDKGRALFDDFQRMLGEVVEQSGAWGKDELVYWKELGVDLVAEEKKQAKEAPALPLAKAEAKQKELPNMPASKKAKIHSAAKARWAKVKAKAGLK